MQARGGENGAWVLVVEDEAYLRQSFVDLLMALAPDLGPIVAVGSAEEALSLCDYSFPACAFVDIQLPGLSGLDLVARLGEKSRVVFVTAHESFALQAFERGAVDYLLKPVSRERMELCLSRLRKRENFPAAELQALLRGLAVPAASQYLKWLAATSGRRTYFISVDDIVYLKSDNKYTRIVCRDSEHLMEESIKKLVLRLDPTQFRQVHRSTLINLREILLVERDEAGGGLLKFRHHSDVVRISGPYLKEMRSFLI